MEWDGQYPDKEDLRRRKIPADKEHRLNMIRYKQHDNMAELSAIRLKFNDGTQSEWFEDSEGGNDIQNIMIDPDRTIASVSMRVSAGTYMHGLRLVDDEGENIVDC